MYFHITKFTYKRNKYLSTLFLLGANAHAFATNAGQYQKAHMCSLIIVCAVCYSV